MGRRRLLAGAGGLLAAGGAAPALGLPRILPDLPGQQGTAFPARSGLRGITLVVPTARAGTTDFAARLLAPLLARRLGQPVAVENRAGANGAAGTVSVAAAPPDGRTLLVQYSGYHVAIPAMLPGIGYDPLRDFVPVGLLLDSPQVLFAHPSVPVRDAAELAEYARQHPGTLGFASSGPGSIQHLGMELWKLRTGTDLRHVPYRGTGQATQDLLNGKVALFMTTPPPLMPYVADGALRALAITSEERHPSLPTVPTLIECGLPGFVLLAWFAIFAPAATPPPILARLQAAVAEAVMEPEFHDRAESLGAMVRVLSPAALTARVTRELAKWRAVVQAAGIRGGE